MIKVYVYLKLTMKASGMILMVKKPNDIYKFFNKKIDLFL